VSQPRVPPEALSWCVSQLSVDYWENRGQMLEKAHKVKEERGFHIPTCGAQVQHSASECASAPIGWPACRHCWSRKREAVVPPVFYGLEP
jgi:hypothetical protein